MEQPRRPRTRAPSSLKDHPLSRRAPPRRARSVSAASRCDVSRFKNTRDNPLFSSTQPNSEGEVLSVGAIMERNVEGQALDVCRSDKGVGDGSSVNGEGGRMRRWRDRHPVSEAWETCSARNWEDTFSSSSFSEAEDAVVRVPFESDCSVDDGIADGIYETVRSEVRRAVSEIRDDIESVIMRTSPGRVSTKITGDIPQGLMNTNMAEFVSDIKREYATKLELSQERARKLRADLAVEEQRGQELSQILEEMVPDSKNSETRKSRPRRKASIERVKMSKLLADEAMNYFDECVSISTFESSDFSSIEDPHLGLPNDIPSNGNSRFFPTAPLASRIATGQQNHYEESDYQTTGSTSLTGSKSAIYSSCSHHQANSQTPAKAIHDDLVAFETPNGGSLDFSFSEEPAEITDVRHYMKNLRQGFQKESAVSSNVRQNYSDEDYDSNTDSNSTPESLLLDRVIDRNRIGSGSLVLCHIRIF